MNQDELTREITDLTKREVARDFSLWLQQGHLDEWRTRTSKCYITETALAAIVARSTAVHGDYVARGELINFAAGLSDYIERDSFDAECVAAFRGRGI